MAPLTRRTPPNMGHVNNSTSESLVLTRGRSAHLTQYAVHDKLSTVADKAIFKPSCRKETSAALSTQFNKLSMADLSMHCDAKFISSTSCGAIASAPVGNKFLSNLIEEQKKCRPLPDYLRRVQKDGIKESMRADIVNWLLELNKHFEYHPETFGVAVNLFDRVLSLYRVQPRLLQLIGATSLLLAAKMQEAWNTHPSLKELTQAGLMFSCADLERMEKVILQRLEWQVNPVTPYLLLHQLVPHLSLPDTVPVQTLMGVAETILDRCHLDYRFIQYEPSTLASCALIQALSKWASVHKPTVGARLVQLTRTPGERLDQCLEEMRLLNWDIAPML